MASFRALDRDRSAPIEWMRGPRIKIKTTCLLKQDIKATISGDVADGGASIRRSAGDPRVDRVDADHRSFDRARGINMEVITVLILCIETHRDRRIAIQRAPFNAFYNAYHEMESGASIENLTVSIFPEWFDLMPLIRTVDAD